MLRIAASGRSLAMAFYALYRDLLAGACQTTRL
jgi:hypothetical protein